MTTEVTTTRQVNGTPTTITLDADLGANLQDAIDRFGQDTVFTYYVKAAKADFQATVGRKIINGDDPDIIQEFMNTNWKPGIKRRNDPVTKVLKQVSTMTDEERLNLINQLQKETSTSAV